MKVDKGIKIALFLSIVFFIANVINYKIIESDKEEKIQIVLDSHIKNLATHYEMVLYNQKIRAKGVYKSTFSNPQVLEIFTQANHTKDKKQLDVLRKKLYKLLSHKYEILKEEGVLQYHFIFPDNTTFLRMHKPSKFGDDLSNVRLDFAWANKHQKELHGFHKGRTSHAFRNIQPIYALNGDFLGLLDVGFSSQVLQDYMNNVSKTHTHFLVKKDIFSVKSWQRDDIKDKYIQANEHQDYMVGISKYFDPIRYNKAKDDFVKIFSTIDCKIHDGKMFTVYSKNRNKIKVISFYPIRSTVTNKLSAWLVSYEDDEVISLIQKGAKDSFRFAFIVLAVIFLFIGFFLHLNEITFIKLDDHYEKKLFFFFSFLFVIFILMTYGILAYIKEKNLQTYENEVKARTVQEFDLLQKQNRLFSKHIFSKHINTSQVKELFKKGDREALYNLLHKEYLSWKNEFSILQVHFHTSDCKSFLRLHNKQYFGDSLKGIRKSVEYVNETHEYFEGYEEGRVVSGFRYIFPMFLHHKYIGSVEISFAPNVFLNEFADLFAKKANMLFNAKLIDTKRFNEYKNPYITSPINGYYFDTRIIQFLEKKNRNIKLTKKSPQEFHFVEEKIKTGKAFTQFFKEAKQLVVVIPLINPLSKDIVATLHIISDAQYILKQESIFVYRFILFALVLLLIMALLYKSLIEKHTNMLEQLQYNKRLEEEIKKALDENTKQLQVLQQQAKMAAMGEMIGAIAHQWRQPLNAVGLSIQNLEYDFKMGLIDEKFIQEYIEENTKTIEFMSKTIDDFRGFFRIDKEKKNFDVKEAIEEVVRMQSSQLKNHNISLEIEGESFDYVGLKSEFQQVILNIINNAKDALIEHNVENAFIKIIIQEGFITIEDNAGGIPSKIIDRVFEPYFTTKEQGKGTGIGMYMSKMIIEDNMGGSLSVVNTDNGAIFQIVLN